MKPVPAKNWDPSLQHVIDDMRGRPLNVHSVMANHPALLNAWWGLRNYLVNGGDLEQRHCELVILRIAVHMRNWYEWGSHVVRGLDSGLREDEVRRVLSGDGTWDAADCALLSAVDEIAGKNIIGENTRALLAPYFTDRQLMDIILLHGMYLTIGCLINTWGIELDDQVGKRLPVGMTEQAFLASVNQEN